MSSVGRTTRSPKTGAAAAALPIVCGDSTAELHPARFGPGGRSVCVLHESRWMTLSQFETLSGRTAAHNWKRSIRHAGRALQHWISAGKLRLCDKYCQCHLCRVPVTRQSMNKPANANLLKVAKNDDDSDSGISSVDSFSKALKVDISASSPVISEQSTTSSESPKPAPTTSETSKTPATPPRPTVLPDYTTLVQEALVALRTDESIASQMNILMYILNRYDPKEDIVLVNSKVKSALLFLTRMALVEKRSVDGTKLEIGDDSEHESEDEDMDTSDRASEENQENTDVNKVKKKAKKDTVKPSKIMKAKKVSEAKAPTKAPMNTLSQPKRLSPQLSVVCGGEKNLCRQEVVKGVWAYIKGNSLQDPKMRTMIICDDTLRAVTKRRRILQTDMLRCLTKHMTELDGSKIKRKRKKKVEEGKKKESTVKEGSKKKAGKV